MWTRFPRREDVFFCDAAAVNATLNAPVPAALMQDIDEIHPRPFSPREMPFVVLSVGQPDAPRRIQNGIRFWSRQCSSTKGILSTAQVN